MTDKEVILELTKQNEQLKKQVYDLKQSNKQNLMPQVVIDITDIIQLAQMKMINKEVAIVMLLQKFTKTIQTINDLFKE